MASKGFNFKQNVTFGTEKSTNVLEVNTIDELKLQTGESIELVYCVETETFYKYVQHGSSYTPNNREVITGNVTDAVWVAISGKYDYDGLDGGTF